MSAPREYRYPGGELELFSRAINWKSYLFAQLAPFLRDPVLEVGAGNGANTEFLRRALPPGSRITALEPDPAQAELVRGRALPGVEVLCGTLADSKPQGRFSTILYLDVLEHIQDDSEELLRAESQLLPGGHLVVLSPAHNFLFSEFDRSIGHFRRYDRATLRAAAPPAAELVALRYLDSVGFLASLANRTLLRQSMPTLPQVLLWDTRMVPLSRLLDRCLAYGLGKSLLGAWRKR